ncbi:MAG: NAD-dependent epimerase/dehydratase family protein [Chitinivibrionales bacterium]|nr:NAD-dependent epimerase/dehydratase family protein [Chitinivibrionales bacterium]
MKAVVIGGTGRVGTYLIPRLVNAGFETVVVGRGTSKPRKSNVVWEWVKQQSINRQEAERAGTFGRQIAELKPDVVIDMICYNEQSARRLADAVNGSIKHLLVCGTHWIYGHSTCVPADESTPMAPMCDYGRGKAAMTRYLLSRAEQDSLPVTVLHPGHIVSTTDRPVNPCGNKNPDVFAQIARGEEITLPNLGMETLHHVHADDLAQGFIKAIEHPDNAIGHSFHIMSPRAITLRGYAEAAYAWFDKQPRLSFLPWPEWKSNVEEKWANQTWEHLAHSPHQSIDKARRLIGYQPRYSSMQAVKEAVMWLIENKVIAI